MLETGEHVSSVSIKRPSCTSPDTVVTTDNNSLFGVYENHTQQLMKQRHFCADDTEQHFRSVAMSVSYANLHSSIASINVSLSLFDVTDNA
eukprot:scaffold12426_cov166-Skeletonema_marinoi.AAC.1